MPKSVILTDTAKEKNTYKMEYVGGDDMNIAVGIKTLLDGDGDFRSKECLEVLITSI